MLTEKGIAKAVANKIFTNEAVPVLERFLHQEYDPSERKIFCVGEIPTSKIEILSDDNNRITQINYSSGMGWTARGRSWTKIH